MKKIIVTCSSIIFAFSCHASLEPTWVFTADNDGPFGLDKEYTNALYASYTSSPVSDDSRLNWLSLSHDSIDKYEFAIGQKMYTPNDLLADVPIANQRPYAGVLFGELNYISIMDERVSRYNFTLGTVGENSLADKAQRLVHEITGSDYPNGWDYQVDEGLIVNLGYLNHLALYRSANASPTQFEITNISELNAGNFRSDISTGLMLRWGKNLSGSLGAANIDKELPFRAGALGKEPSGWFAFSGIKARYRFNDVTLEGDRPGIPDPENYPVTLDKKQATAVAGFAWYNAQFGASFTAAIGSSEYQEAKDNYHSNASFSLFFFL
ncbi:exonuclease [Vibrio ponticus]|uniref:Exonuclease n=1 Tax=Vibrio ponticus TaxID=265668 RepID=A0ABX3FNB5_9VIBR|nr:lipid A deacylase LpxR family protein [Vibrio ponticus]OLQ94246.1 exonuclease [Vibrio ponticus]